MNNYNNHKKKLHYEIPSHNVLCRNLRRKKTMMFQTSCYRLVLITCCRKESRKRRNLERRNKMLTKKLNNMSLSSLLLL